MKVTILVLGLLLGSISQAQLLNYCEELIEGEYAEFCGGMKYMRATINVFDQQREMGLVNYKYIQNLGAALKANSETLVQAAPPEIVGHTQAIRNVGEMGEEIRVLAENKDADVFRVTNLVRNQCLSCHGATGPKGGSWNEVFKYDWVKIAKNCNAPGRNPYLCKSMNSMATSYGHMFTAYTAKIHNYEVTESVATEVVRVLKDLKKNNFLHMAEDFRVKALTSAEEVVELAAAKNPEVFEKSFYLSRACTECHSSNHYQTPKSTQYQIWN